GKGEREGTRGGGAPRTVTWLPQAESGTEGTTIALGAIPATANSLPGHSNSLQSLVVSGIPVGDTLSDGHGHSFTATAGNTQVDVNGWTLSSLTILRSEERRVGKEGSARMVEDNKERRTAYERES